MVDSLREAMDPDAFRRLALLEERNARLLATLIQLNAFAAIPGASVAREVVTQQLSLAFAEWMDELARQGRESGDGGRRFRDQLAAEAHADHESSTGPAASWSPRVRT